MQCRLRGVQICATSILLIYNMTTIKIRSDSQLFIGLGLKGMGSRST